MDETEIEEMRIIEEEFQDTEGTMSDKLDAAYTKYQGFPISDENTFWRHMAYNLAEIADNALSAMRKQHEEMLAFKFELELREEEFGFEHKSPTNIKKQWDDHQKAVHAKLDALRTQREGTK
jgi:hypothetical protein